MSTNEDVLEAIMSETLPAFTSTNGRLAVRWQKQGGRYYLEIDHDGVLQRGGPDDRIRLELQGDGNVVLRQPGVVLWASGTTFRSPPPPLPPPDPNSDEIDLTDITWLHTDISQWPKTSTITGVSTSETRVCIFHTMAGKWPAYQDVKDDPNTIGEGNPWVFAKIDDQWYGATWEWLRPGQQCKNVHRTGKDGIGAHTALGYEQHQLSSWEPQVGELVGFAMSTRARSSGPGITVHQRSNIVLMRWAA